MIKSIFFYPDDLPYNPYMRLEKAILADLCPQIKPLSLRQLTLSFLRRDTSIALINFLEDRMGYRKERINIIFAQNILVMIVTKLLCRNVVWVRHNYWPHDLPRGNLQHLVLLKAMRMLATRVVTHRRAEGIVSSVLPHPLYDKHDVLPDTIRDIDFLVFGAIRRYKGLEKLLSTWPSGHRLLIVGAAPDHDLSQELRRIVQERAIDVEIRDRYVSEGELESLLLRTKYVILSHIDNAMIVSGTFYHATAFGANIIARQSDFSCFLQQAYSFVSIYEEGRLADTLAELKYVDPNRVLEQVRATNGRVACRDAWSQLFADLLRS